MTMIYEMTAKLLTFSLKYKLFVLANQDFVNYQSLLPYILRMRISNKTVERQPSTVQHIIWITLDSAMFRYSTRV